MDRGWKLVLLFFPSVPVPLATDTYPPRFHNAVSGFVSAWYFTLSGEAGVLLGREVQRWVHISSSMRVLKLYSVLSYVRVLTRTQADTGLAMVIATNVLTTSLIAGRVWWYKRNVLKAYGERALSSTSLILYLSEHLRKKLLLLPI